MWIIIEQLMGNSSVLCISFLDSEKEFDSWNRSSLWTRLVRHDLIKKIVNIVRNSCDELSYMVVLEKLLTDRSKRKMVSDKTTYSPFS